MDDGDRQGEQRAPSWLAFTKCFGMDEDDKLSSHPSPVDADAFAYPGNASDDYFIRYR